MAINLHQYALGFFITASLVLFLMRSAGGEPFAGYFIAYTDAFTPCEKHEWNHKMEINVSTTRFNKQQPLVLQRLSGTVSLQDSPGVEDVNWGNVRLDSRFNSDWKKNAFIFNFPTGACSALREHIPDFTRAAFGKEVLKKDPCFIPPRHYVIKDEPVNWTFPKFPIMPYGHWRFHFTLGRGQETHMCFNVECHTIPRPKHVPAQG